MCVFLPKCAGQHAYSALNIAAGQKVGVLGAIGSGKSTLLRLLSGMYQPLTGKVLLDGVDMSHISRQILSEQTAI